MSKLNSIIENKNQLIQYFEDGCKPKSSWKIGTEHEKFGFIKRNLKPLPYQGDCSVLSVLKGLIDTFGWKPIEENKFIIGLNKDSANITLELRIKDRKILINIKFFIKHSILLVYLELIL